jgi:TPR repeat protein
MNFQAQNTLEIIEYISNDALLDCHSKEIQMTMSDISKKVSSFVQSYIDKGERIEESQLCQKMIEIEQDLIPLCNSQEIESSESIPENSSREKIENIIIMSRIAFFMYSHGKDSDLLSILQKITPHDDIIHFLEMQKENGSIEAISIIGHLYEIGQGYEKDEVKAFECFLEAAQKGNSQSQLKIGLMYLHGKNIEKNEKEAFKWFMKSTKNNGSKSNYIIGLMYFQGVGVEQNDKESVIWLESSAMQNNVSAQYLLSTMYLNGEGVNKDKEKAFFWSEKASKQGHTDAQWNIGFMHYYGDGTSKNVELGFKWLEKACVIQDSKKQYTLSKMYKDYNEEKAMKWLQESAKQGCVEAQFELAYTYETGNGNTKNEEEAIVWYTKAAEQNHFGAQMSLGMMHFIGMGTDANTEKSKFYYDAAIDSAVTMQP